MHQDVYVKDRVTGDLWLESLDSTGQFLDASEVAMGGPSISDDGRFVVFHTDSAKLNPAGTPKKVVALRDRWLRTTTAVIENAYRATISGDGRFIAAVLESCGPQQLVVHDRLAHRTIRVSVAPDGRFGDGSIEGDADLSRDGRLITFRSRESNLVADDTNGVADIFVARIGDGAGPRGSFTDPTDIDGDGTADECDGDDDNDSIPDGFETRYALNPQDAADASADADQDGMTNLEEYRARSNPTSPDTDGDGVRDAVDNCILHANADQANLDGDARGDRCDNDPARRDAPPGGGGESQLAASQPAPGLQSATTASGGGGAIGHPAWLLLLALTMIKRSRGGASLARPARD